MARVNVGIDPKLLSDQHLIAESVEITMIVGSLRKTNFKFDETKTPLCFTLGKGHISFFRDKIKYLKRRLDAVNLEMRLRGFSPGTNIDEQEIPIQLFNDWNPSFADSALIKERISDRMLNPIKASKSFHRYKKQSIADLNEFTSEIRKSEIFPV